MCVGAALRNERSENFSLDVERRQRESFLEQKKQKVGCHLRTNGERMTTEKLEYLVARN